MPCSPVVAWDIGALLPRHVFGWESWVGRLQKIFYRLDEEIQHGLTFPPKKGEWPQRVRFWQEILRPDLEEKMYYAAMEKLFAWSIHCVKDRGEKVEESESGCVRMEIFA